MFKWVSVIAASVVLVYSMTVIVDVLTAVNPTTVDHLIGGAAAFAAFLSFIGIARGLTGIRRSF